MRNSCREPCNRLRRPADGAVAAGRSPRLSGAPAIDFAGPEIRGDAGRRHREPRNAVGLAGRDAMGRAGGSGRPVLRRLPRRRAGQHEGCRARYPAFDTASAGPLDLEGRINRCRTEHQQAEPLAWESRICSALTAFVAVNRAGCRSTASAGPELRPFSATGRETLQAAAGPAEPVLQPVPRRQLGQAPRRQRDPAGAHHRLSGIQARMAGPRLAAAALAQLHDRGAGRAFPLWIAELCGAGNLPHGAAPDLALEAPSIRP